MIRKVDRTFYLVDGKGNKRLGRIGFVESSMSRLWVFVSSIRIPGKHFFIKCRGYPLNLELLNSLKRGGIRYIIIPEEGKQGFNCYCADIDQYLNGEPVHYDLDEQRCIPLEELKPLSINHDVIIDFMNDSIIGG